MTAPIRDEDREAAHALCLSQGICDVGCGEALCDAIAQAIADSRERVLSEVANFNEAGTAIARALRARRGAK